MAHKFYQRYVQANDITDPRDWNLNQQDLIEEWNGRLDRDNIDQSVVTTAMIKGNAFSVIRNDSYAEGAADVVLEGGTTAWRTGDGTNTIGRIEVEFSSSVMIRAWWSAYWEWVEFDYIVQGGSGATLVTAVAIARFRITIDGIEVSRIHKTHHLRTFHSGYCVGSLQVDAGKHIIEVQAKMFRLPDNAAIGTSVDFPLGGDVKELHIKARDLVIWARRQ